MESILSELESLCHQCLLPELTDDIGSDLIDSKHFDKFRIDLNQNLHKIIDILSDRHNETIIQELPKTVELGLILLFCEQTAKHIEFRTDQLMLTQHLETLRSRIEKYVSNESTRDCVFSWYKKHINATLWKRNLGATHGLATFCEILTNNDQPWVISIDDGMFLLSAGTLMMEHFEHLYKEIGLTIFLADLHKMSDHDLKLTNLYEPIFDVCKQNISNIKDFHINRLLWTCLIECLRLKPDCQLDIPSKWNHRDDVCSALLRRLAMESDERVRFLLMRCIVDVFAPGHNLKLLGASNDVVYGVDFQQLRISSNDSNCLVSYRWTKKLMSFFSYNVSCLFRPATDVAFNLRVVHICYVVCLFGIPLTLIAVELRDFLDEIPTHLMHLIQRNNHNVEIVKEVDQILQTFVEHLERVTVNLSEMNVDFCRQRSKTLSEIRTIFKKANLFKN